MFKLVSKGKSRVIVESLNTGKRMPTFITSRISTLEDVAIYTTEGDVPLREVFLTMFDKFEGGEALSGKPTNAALISLMEEILPNYDTARVYVSDMKKMVNWYNSLVVHGLLTQEVVDSERAAATSTDIGETATTEAVAEESPASQAADTPPQD